MTYNPADGSVNYRAVIDKVADKVFQDGLRDGYFGGLRTLYSYSYWEGFVDVNDDPDDEKMEEAIEEYSLFHHVETCLKAYKQKFERAGPNVEEEHERQ